MKLMLIYIVNILIVGLFLYSKLLPYKNKLNPQYKSVFEFFSKIFSPVLNFLKRFVKPFQVGQSLAVDMTQIVLLLIILNAY
ncbi:MAG: YggT family protein [Bacteroidetes bacterium]|nr:YggT family protein [Bacteroidota bacterium]